MNTLALSHCCVLDLDTFGEVKRACCERSHFKPGSLHSNRQHCLESVRFHKLNEKWNILKVPSCVFHKRSERGGNQAPALSRTVAIPLLACSRNSAFNTCGLRAKTKPKLTPPSLPMVAWCSLCA